MKKSVLLLLFLPVFAMAQYDFDTRYFTITAESLPEIEDLTAPSFSLEKGPTFSTKLKTFQMNVDNYRQPVDMATAVNDGDKYIQRNVDVGPLQQKLLGSVGVKPGYQTDGTTTVKNIAYKEVRGLNLMDPCPPYGICSRCAHYRVGRGY
ncbi:hypothetical protein ATE92_2579 [Ulvibacter sp. MAR_2010_11]|uniref:hypothetical protein n=1 Tax=Ulvibacter sp. MAR_2010_11 TaxID=1250229 RepID=UPI000C2CACEE|nr:hypothetical protein [Ulvibacter sp. MAR_2010_11]PKA84391.1 hypothetical protein ATE92_2579 [Ulvibacter sp. MAR_2010_11]